MSSQRKKEILVYLCAWALIFALVPLFIGIHVISGHDSHFSVAELLLIWRQMLPFFLLFVIHDTLLLPLIKGYSVRNTVIYLVCLAAILVLFGIYCFHGSTPSGPLPMPHGNPAHPGPPGPFRPFKPELMKFVIGLLTVVANLGVAAMFRAIKNDRRLRQMEKENVSRQLEALRYQVNPHFFLNTLNNIHTLVETDPEKARESIELFSRLMRLVLTDGSASLVPLDRELQYLQSFVELMRIRYPESVDITLSLPSSGGDAVVIPLAMASCAENAFKHGISYEEPSFVHMDVNCEGGKVFFTCRNSVHDDEGDGQGGLGLENLRRRLDLTYGDAYSLDITCDGNTYAVTIVLPSTWEVKS